MSSSIRLGATMIALAAVLAACGQTIDTGSPAATAAPTATATPTPVPTPIPGPPSAPSGFLITRVPNGPYCPSAMPTIDSDTCDEFDFSWYSTEGRDVWFRIFEGHTAEGGSNCSDLSASGQRHSLLTTAPGARRATEFDIAMYTNAGRYCYWIAAVNAQGSSAMVLGTGWQ